MFVMFPNPSDPQCSSCVASLKDKIMCHYTLSLLASCIDPRENVAHRSNADRAFHGYWLSIGRSVDLNTRRIEYVETVSSYWSQLPQSRPHLYIVLNATNHTIQFIHVFLGIDNFYYELVNIIYVCWVLWDVFIKMKWTLKIFFSMLSWWPGS
jgi:hypothetical protein